MTETYSGRIQEEQREATQLEARATTEWSRIAGEAVRCEVIGGELYAFGSELAMLRLEHTLRIGRALYSENLKTWTYCGDRS